MLQLSANVEVPGTHVAEGRTPAYDGGSNSNRFTVHTGCKKPCDCYTAIGYKGNWFWIDDTDLESKRTMFFLSIILALADTSHKKRTIPDDLHAMKFTEVDKAVRVGDLEAV
ncbi:hypothetical protein BH11PLA2_BH11PLA2_14460 [soil metagenome]